MDILLGLVSAFLLVGASATLGMFVWRWVSVADGSCLSCELAIGLALSGYLLLILAALGILNLTVVLGIFGFLSIYTLFAQKSRLMRAVACTNLISAIRKGDKWDRLGWGIVVILLLAAIIEALAPATTSDALSYHLRIPYDYVVEGGLIYSPFQPYNMPHLMQMLVTLPFLLGAGDVGAHLTYFIFCILLIAALYRLASQYFDQKIALLAVILFISTPMFSYIKVSGMVEVGLTAMILLSIWALLNGLNADEKYRYRWMLASGLFIGVACGTKYYGLFAGAVAFLLIVVISYREMDWSVALRSSSVFAAGALVLGVPFYIKNMLMTGNPLFPALFDLLAGRDWSAEMAQLAKSYFDAYKRPAGDGLLDLVLSPWRLTMDGEKFLAGRTGYGFIYLAFLPLIMIWLVKNLRFNGLRTFLPSKSTVSIFVWIVILFWVLWFLLAFQRGRHLMPVFAILSVLTASAAMSWLRESIPSKWEQFVKYSVAAVLVSGITFQVLIGGYFTKTFLPVAFGFEDREVFMDRIRPMWRDYQKVNQVLPPDAKVLHLFGDRQYYLKRSQFYPSPYFQGWVDWANIPDVNAYRNQLKNAGFTHVIGPHSEGASHIKPVDDESGRENILKFHKLNGELIRLYSRKVFENTRLIPRSRTASLGTKSKSFVLYELI